MSIIIGRREIRISCKAEVLWKMSVIIIEISSISSSRNSTSAYNVVGQDKGFLILMILMMMMMIVDVGDR